MQRLKRLHGREPGTDPRVVACHAIANQVDPRILGVKGMLVRAHVRRDLLIGEVLGPGQLLIWLRGRIGALDGARRSVSKEVQSRFPAYAEFVNPKAPGLAQVRAALREGEVLLSVLTTADETFVWSIPKSGAIGFHTAALGGPQRSTAVDHAHEPASKPRRNTERRPEGDDDCDPAVQADAVDEQARDRRAHGVRERERREDVAVAFVGEVKFILEERSERGKNLPVDKAERGGEHQQAGAQPPQRQSLLSAHRPPYRHRVTVRSMPGGHYRFRAGFAR